MTREELRDQMLAPVLKWTRLGRQANEAAMASFELGGQRGHRLLRVGMFREACDWSEWTQVMVDEPVRLPLESAAAMASALPSAAQQWAVRHSEAVWVCAGSALSLSASRSPAEFTARQEAFCQTWLGAAMGAYQWWGVCAEILGQGLQPVQEAARIAADRLRKR